MKSFKITTTGKDMLSDIVLAGYDAGVVETCPECEGSNLNEERTICFDCNVADEADTE
jgi:hypothetical protein